MITAEISRHRKKNDRYLKVHCVDFKCIRKPTKSLLV